MAPASLENLPFGVDGSLYQWLDLEGEGLPGIFTEAAKGWYYRNNRGQATFTPVRLVAEKPMLSAANGAPPVFSDIDADGVKELLLNSPALNGYVEQKDERWDQFTPFAWHPTFPLHHPDLKYIDLTGNGLADLLISEDEVFTWYASLGKAGYSPPSYVRKALEEEKGPALLFSTPEQNVYLADMTGDGLNDIVRICNGEICYWPNTGYGTFGARIVMANAPCLDSPDLFDQKNIRLFDVDGTGTTDLLYAAADGVKLYYNCSGNSWSQASDITGLPLLHPLSTLSVTDLLGSGTGCLVWSSSAPADAASRLAYLPLMREKPYLLTSINNQMGKEMQLAYASSTEFYLDDLRQGTPWITKLPFPVQVLRQVTVVDHIASSRLTTRYKYHHGYYDGPEREFRGFGMVEQTDSESFATYNPGNALDMPPIHTKSWFHTGAYTQAGVFSLQYASEYFAADALAYTLPDSIIEHGEALDYANLREACRALKGRTLRQEVYARDGGDKEGIPYTVTQTNFRVRQLQPRTGQTCGVYLTLDNESVVHAYERNPNDPRVAHTLLLEADAYGQPLKSVQIAYPRRSAVAEAYPEQKKVYVTAQTHTYFNETTDFYLLGVVLQQQTYEINGLEVETDACFHFQALTSQLAHVFDENVVLLHHEPFGSGPQARRLAWTKNYFWKDPRTGLPFGGVSALALPHHTEQIVMSTAWASQVYGARITDALMEQAGYVNRDGHWWNPGTTIHYLDEASFCVPYQTTDAFGNQSRVYFDAYALAAIRAENALGNTVTADIDYRTLAAKKTTDSNGTTSEALTDPLGLVIATTMYGTVDGLAKGDSPLSRYQPTGNVTTADVLADPNRFLQEATSFFYYNLEAWAATGEPPHFISLTREIHVSELAGNASPVRVQLGYWDGFGRELQSKVKTDPDAYGNEQWLVTGRVVYNNKQKPVKQYEPFYTPTYAYQNEAEVAPVGVSPVIYYDPLGRVYRTETPKGFHSKVEFDPWQQRTFDENDTVKDALYYQAHSGAGDEEALALTQAEAYHYNTPSLGVLDSLARPFMTWQYAHQGGAPLITHTVFDIQGHPLTCTDPRQYAANASRGATEQVHNFSYHHDLAGNLLYTHSCDAGETWGLLNVAGKPVHGWNGRGYHSHTDYDALQRPLRVTVAGNGLNQVVQRIEYGENEPDAAARNLNGQVARHYDEAGLVENHLFDFKGQLLSASRTLRSDYKTEANWNDPATVSLESETFTSEMAYDALGRTIRVTQPDGSISRPAFYQTGWLRKVDVQLKGDSAYTTFVESIAYNAKGQRTLLVYGNGVRTSYTYEETTFRLTRLLTTRPEASGNPTVLQDIGYLYDPVGNIIKITDHSQERVFTANQQVDAENAFVYDALYQLTQATGREHRALSKTDYQQRSDVYKTAHFANINDASQLRTYTRQYAYDQAGNLTQIRHVGENSFTRTLTVSAVSNRAITDAMDHTAPVESYFDAAGNLKQLDHIQGMVWNYRNNIASATIIERNSENDGEYYVYDATGERIRKVKETCNRAGVLLWKEEKIYLGGLELKRKYQGAAKTLREDRSALHVMDDTQRIAIVYYWHLSSDSSVTPGKNKVHYQLGNHLGSAAMELSESGQLISYEEYFPFGGTSFTAGSNAAEVALKEYRYTGKERDDTTGLCYYGARYYASWLGRWLSPDPAGTADGLNLYGYVKNNPVKYVDPNGKGTDDFDALPELDDILREAPAEIDLGLATALDRTYVDTTLDMTTFEDFRSAFEGSDREIVEQAMTEAETIRFHIDKLEADELFDKVDDIVTHLDKFGETGLDDLIKDGRFTAYEFYLMLKEESLFEKTTFFEQGEELDKHTVKALLKPFKTFDFGAHITRFLGKAGKAFSVVADFIDPLMWLYSLSKEGYMDIGFLFNVRIITDEKKYQQYLRSLPPEEKRRLEQIERQTDCQMNGVCLSSDTA